MSPDNRLGRVVIGGTLAFGLSACESANVQYSSVEPTLSNGSMISKVDFAQLWPGRDRKAVLIDILSHIKTPEGDFGPTQVVPTAEATLTIPPRYADEGARATPEVAGESMSTPTPPASPEPTMTPVRVRYDEPEWDNQVESGDSIYQGNIRLNDETVLHAETRRVTNEKGTFLVLEAINDESVQRDVWGRIVLQEDLDTPTAQSDWVLRDVRTDPNHRNQGVASELIEYMKEQATLQGVGYIWGIVVADDTGGVYSPVDELIEFYEKQGANISERMTTISQKGEQNYHIVSWKISSNEARPIYISPMGIVVSLTSKDNT